MDIEAIRLECLKMAIECSVGPAGSKEITEYAEKLMYFVATGKSEPNHDQKPD